MNPVIRISKSINKTYDYNDENTKDIPFDLYHAIINDGFLEMAFIVKYKDKRDSGEPYDYITVDSPTYLYIKPDPRVAYPSSVMNGNLCEDSSIIEELFTRYLIPYGIKIHSIQFRNHIFFETLDYEFEDKDLKEKLKALINKACKKQLQK